MDKNDYYQATSDWAYELYLSKSLWLRWALFGLILMAVLLGLSLLSNLFLFPLKEKVPYLYAFDHATGEITKIGELEPIRVGVRTGVQVMDRLRWRSPVRSASGTRCASEHVFRCIPLR